MLSTRWYGGRRAIGAWVVALAGLAIGSVQAAQAQPAGASVFLEELTSTELRAQIAHGTSTVLVPIGGTEQNGPHMVLGKHNVRVHLLAGQIAQELGQTVVAPVLAYVPEGAVNPPTAHMRFSGTVSIPEAAFEAVLEGAARSFRQHGLRDIVFLGDHGGYQKSLQRVAARLNHEWAASAVRVHALPEYYQLTQTVYVQSLKARGFSDAEIGSHAGLADTALALALEPALVRSEVLSSGRALGASEGVYGDPRRASAEAGRPGLQLVFSGSVQAIRAALLARGKP
ncbi:MAG: creatininase family protein [Rhodoferax sp.]